MTTITTFTNSIVCELTHSEFSKLYDEAVKKGETTLTVEQRCFSTLDMMTGCEATFKTKTIVLSFIESWSEEINTETK
jgi:hypothetical protein